MRILLSSFLFLIPTVSFSFAEDICYSKQGGLQNCFSQPCQPGETSLTCQAKAIKQLQTNVENSNGGRSTLHTDATYYFAQVLGFNSDQAHLIASYNEAADIGTYIPHDNQGNALVTLEECKQANPPAACKLVTKDIMGVTRFKEPGFMLHYVIPYNPEQKPINGLYPDIFDAKTEVTLANMRQWVYQNTVFCTAGVTTLSSNGDYGTGDQCFKSINLIQDSYMEGSLPVNLKLYEFAFSLDEQIISQNTISGSPITSHNFSEYVGQAEADFARFGIYLHSLADRISHHQCGDASAIKGPNESDNFSADFNIKQCSHGLHTLWHSWEAGVEQDQLPTEARTLEAALNIMYDEIAAFARAKGIAVENAQAVKEKHVKFLVKAIEEPDAKTRVKKITDKLIELDLQPLPGH
jgi:hypothetical protein